MSTYCDIKVDFDTGRIFIDETTGDAFLIYDDEVILQDAAIKLRTQVGTIQNQGLDNFGWNYLSAIKEKTNASAVQLLTSAITALIMEDERIEDVDLAIQSDPLNDAFVITAFIYINGNVNSLVVTIPGA